MSQKTVKRGSTDQSVVIRIIDSTAGTPETGVVYNTTGIDMWYRREKQARVAITEANLSALTTAHVDGGFLHIDDGYYRLDLPDAAVASSAGINGVMVAGSVPAMIVIGTYVELVSYDPTDSVRAGLTALPNAAADAAGGLAISDAGGLDLDKLKLDVTSVLTDTATTLPATLALVARTTHLTSVSGKVDAVDNFVDTEIASMASQLTTIDGIVDSILTDTGTTLPATLAALAQASALVDAASQLTTIDGIVDDILTDTGTTLPATLAALAQASALVDAASQLTTIDGIVDDILTDTGTTLPAGITSVQTSIDGISTDAVASAVWDIVLASHLTAGSTGAGLNAAGAAGDPWSTALPGAYGVGEAGLIIGSLIARATALSSVASQLTTVDGIVDDILVDTAAIPSSTLVASAVWNVTRASHTTVGSFGEVSTVAQMQAGLAQASALTDVASQLTTIDGIVDSILVDTGTTLQGEVDGIQADTENIQSRLPSALVGGRIDASVGAMAAAVVTAAAVATNAIDADALATDAVTEIQSGLAKTTHLTSVSGKVDTVDGIVDDILVDTGTTLPATLAQASALVDAASQLTTIDSIVDAILVDTGTTLDGRIPSALVSGRMDSYVGAQANIDFGALQKASLNAATPASIVGDIGGLSAPAITDVQTAVGNELDEAISEPANLSATKSVRTFLWHLYSRFFHKNTQTATQQITYKANGTTPLATRTVSDDSTTQTLGAGS